MVSTIISAVIASELVIAAVVVGCVTFAVIAELTDLEHKAAIARFSRNLYVFMMPLLFLFAYIVIIWGANIVTS